MLIARGCVRVHAQFAARHWEITAVPVHFVRPARSLTARFCKGPAEAFAPVRQALIRRNSCGMTAEAATIELDKEKFRSEMKLQALRVPSKHIQKFMRMLRG